MGTKPRIKFVKEIIRDAGRHNENIEENSCREDRIGLLRRISSWHEDDEMIRIAHFFFVLLLIL